VATVLVAEDNHMTTTMKIVLDDAQLLALGQRLTGKKQKATRKQVLDWAQQLLDSDLAGKDAPTELRGFVCPKCQRPISLRVPKAKAEAAEAQPAKSATKGDVAAKAIAAAEALDQAAAKLRDLAK
jgi:hypothetical protein